MARKLITKNITNHFAKECFEEGIAYVLSDWMFDMENIGDNQEERMMREVHEQISKNPQAVIDYLRNEAEEDPEKAEDVQAFIRDLEVLKAWDKDIKTNKHF